VKIDLLHDGFFTLDKSLIVYMKYMGQPYDAALKSLLISTPEENILVDTGAGQLPEKYRQYYPIKRKPNETLQTELLKHDLKPEDIDFVVNTHLHFDHCGNNALFKNAKFIVQAEEYRYAFEPERFQQTAYIRELFDVNVDYQQLHGKRKIVDGVSIVPTPGHSIGHQSVLVEVNGKNYVYCGDAAPIKENLERRNIPGVLYCPHKALESIDCLKTMKNAYYIYSHDNEQMTLSNPK
jgi:glyoxylase-like metal-dependent hydrolase (beta-lactamase superfamily II)